MIARYDLDVDAPARRLGIRVLLTNNTRRPWLKHDFFLGWQLFDPESNRFIREGQWLPIEADAAPGETVPLQLQLDFPPEPGGYRIYVSPIQQSTGWAYTRGETFLAVDASIAGEQLAIDSTELTTKAALRRRAFWRAIPKAFQYPFSTVARNQRLIRSMVRRDILARYRGSFGDVFWTVLNPLLLMATYFFVFGVVLHTRFGADSSSTGFVLYFLAGMLPWLAFSEPAGRAPHVVLEHRNFVKKLIFPLETLPVNQVISGFVTELFGLGVFLMALLLLRGAIPSTVAVAARPDHPATPLHPRPLLVPRGPGSLLPRPRPSHGLSAHPVVLHHAHLLPRNGPPQIGPHHPRQEPAVHPSPRLPGDLLRARRPRNGPPHQTLDRLHRRLPARPRLVLQTPQTLRRRNLNRPRPKIAIKAVRHERGLSRLHRSNRQLAVVH